MRYTFYLGTGKLNWPELKSASHGVASILDSTFSGFTRYETYGEWVASDGLLYCEQTHVYEVITTKGLSTQELNALALQFGQLFHQEAVLWTASPIDMSLVTIPHDSPALASSVTSPP